MGLDWFTKNYPEANNNVPGQITEVGLTPAHIKAFEEYNKSLLNPPETKSQIFTGCILSLCSVAAVMACIFILSDGLTFKKFDNNLKTASLSTMTAIIGFLAGNKLGQKN